MLSREKRHFFLRWLSSPLHIGVPVPSSSTLATAMAAQLAIGPDEYVVELGPGTGVITRALSKAGIKEHQLVVIERDPRFVEKLKKDFPRALILQGDARDLKSLLARHGITEIAAVVSSLPLLSMPQMVRRAIVGAAFAVIKPSGLLIQYTYGLMSPVSKHHQTTLGIQGSITKHVWRNFPPARVWRYTAAA